jgi:hypothetical protein
MIDNATLVKTITIEKSKVLATFSEAVRSWPNGERGRPNPRTALANLWGNAEGRGVAQIRRAGKTFGPKPSDRPGGRPVHSKVDGPFLRFLILTRKGNMKYELTLPQWKTFISENFVEISKLITEYLSLYAFSGVASEKKAALLAKFGIHLTLPEYDPDSDEFLVSMKKSLGAVCRILKACADSPEKYFDSNSSALFDYLGMVELRGTAKIKLKR